MVGGFCLLLMLCSLLSVGGWCFCYLVWRCFRRCRLLLSFKLSLLSWVYLPWSSLLFQKYYFDQSVFIFMIIIVGVVIICLCCGDCYYYHYCFDYYCYCFSFVVVVVVIVIFIVVVVVVVVGVVIGRSCFMVMWLLLLIVIVIFLVVLLLLLLLLLFFLSLVLLLLRCCWVLQTKKMDWVSNSARQKKRRKIRTFEWIKEKEEAKRKDEIRKEEWVGRRCVSGRGKLRMLLVKPTSIKTQPETLNPNIINLKLIKR